MLGLNIEPLASPLENTKVMLSYDVGHWAIFWIHVYAQHFILSRTYIASVGDSFWFMILLWTTTTCLYLFLTAILQRHPWPAKRRSQSSFHICCQFKGKMNPGEDLLSGMKRLNYTEFTSPNSLSMTPVLSCPYAFCCLCYAKKPWRLKVVNSLPPLEEIDL